MESVEHFLTQIGIPVIEETITEDTFLPGILIRNGTLVVDRAKMLYPGDLLHEAGHIAVTPPEERVTKAGNMSDDKNMNESAGEEIMAICWSYAAAVHLGLPPEYVFHPEGYKGASKWYIEQFAAGIYIGLPALQWLGLCYDAKRAQEHQVAPYPHMIRWLREKPAIES